MREPFEDDREDNAVSERDQWAEDHGYVHGRCRIHGGFWTDSGDGCPQCEPEAVEDEQQEDYSPVQRRIEHFAKLRARDEEVEEMEENLQAIRQAAKAARVGSTFFIDALRQGGFFSRPN